MKNVICVFLLLGISLMGPIACTTKPVEKPPEKKDDTGAPAPKEPVDPKMPKIG
jgi:hypothetical protein